MILNKEHSGDIVSNESVRSLKHTPHEAVRVFDDAKSFDEFQQPPFPLSQSAWLVGLGEAFFAKYKRGVVALLCLDVAAKTWVKPVLPSQRCHALGSSFILLSSDFDQLSKSCRIAGSFQIGSPSSEEDARATVPNFEGLHLVMSRRVPEQTRHCFLRVEGQLCLVEPEAVMTDDWREYLLHYRERLIFV